MTDVTFLGPLTLEKGAHKRGSGMCAMEAAAYLGGEAHSDTPACVSPVIATFMRRWNDRLPDTERQRLKPLIPLVLYTATGLADDRVRSWLCADWVVRDRLPYWLERAKLTTHAEALRALPPLTDKTSVDRARPVIQAARAAAADADAAAYAYAADAADAAAYATAAAYAY